MFLINNKFFEGFLHSKLSKQCCNGFVVDSNLTCCMGFKEYEREAVVGEGVVNAEMVGENSMGGGVFQRYYITKDSHVCCGVFYVTDSLCCTNSQRRTKVSV